MLRCSGGRCLYRYLFKENPHLSLKKKKEKVLFYINGPTCLIQKTLIKNSGGSSKLILTTVGEKPKRKLCEGFCYLLIFLELEMLEEGLYCFPCFCVPCFSSHLRKRGLQFMIVKPLWWESNITWAKVQC